MAQPNTLSDKVAWITGGGSGIGLAAAQALKGAGATVVISGRNEKTLQHPGLETMLLDVSDRGAVAATAQRILAKHGRIDILVNSAGINLPKRNLKNVSVEGWDEIVAINLSGTFYPCHAVLPSMRERKDGLIINVSSWFGRYANALGQTAGPLSRYRCGPGASRSPRRDCSTTSRTSCSAAVISGAAA